MRELVCPVCDGTQRSLIYPSTLPAAFTETAPPSPYSAHYQINRCVTCGLVHSSPIMDDSGVAKLYEKSSETNVVPGEEDNVRRTMSLYYRLAAPYLAGRTRILDIGCDMGFLLEAARDDGFAELYGIEPNPTARRVAAKIEGSTVSDDFYERLDYPDNHFDLITLIHVVDHLVDPRIVLTRAARHLRPGGLAVAVVHNLESLLGRLLGERFPVFNLYHHFFFSKATLAQLFQRHGFEVIKVVSTRNCYSLGFFAERLPDAVGSARAIVAAAFERFGLSKVPVTIPIGNIGIVARRL